MQFHPGLDGPSTTVSLMGRLAVGLFCCVLWMTGCTAKGEAIQAAQPYLKSFATLRMRTLRTLELRADVERKKRLLHAIEHPEDPVPKNLEPLLEEMRNENVELTQDDIDYGEQLVAKRVEAVFADHPDILQGEIVFVERNGEVSRFADPPESEMPAGVQWYGLRQQRTFAGLARCFTDDGAEPCVLIQLRPRDYSGSAGLTVAFRRP